MPILAREPETYPDDLFERLGYADGPWWVAHVRSRQEKKLARYLREQGTGHYLPQYEQRTRSLHRERISHLPLFSGYVFFRANWRERRAALKSNVVVNLLEVSDQELLERELRDLWQAQRAGLPLVPYPYIGPGDAIGVIDGPFASHRGIVLRTKGRLRLVVTISFLRRSVAVELDREVVSRVHAA